MFYSYIQKKREKEAKIGHNKPNKEDKDKRYKHLNLIPLIVLRIPMMDSINVQVTREMVERIGH